MGGSNRPDQMMPDAEAQDRAEIVARIEAETAAWLAGDVAGWAECWVQDESAQHTIARPSVGARIMQGFDALSAYFVPHIEANIGREDGQAKVIRKNWRINIRGDMAWATFEQHLPLTLGVDYAPGRHHQMRVMERREGVWKIAGLFQIPNRIGYYTSPWVRVDGAGKILGMGEGTEEALSTHPSLMRVGERICTRNPVDKPVLTAAIEEADDLIRSRRGRPPRTIVLNHAEGNAISMAWVTNADMMIVVLLGDEGMLSSSIGRAGEVFGLTPAQVRIAVALAQGKTTSAIAKEQGVTPNTVRTHVKRMFERLDVNSQTALIRTLMSADAPSNIGR